MSKNDPNNLNKFNPTFLSIFLLKSVSDPFFLFRMGQKRCKKGPCKKGVHKAVFTVLKLYLLLFDKRIYYYSINYYSLMTFWGAMCAKPTRAINPNSSAADGEKVILQKLNTFWRRSIVEKDRKSTIMSNFE